MRELYADHTIIQVQAFSGMKIKKNTGERVLNREVLIVNFPPPDGVVEYSKPRQARFEQLYLLDKAEQGYAPGPGIFDESGD